MPPFTFEDLGCNPLAGVFFVSEGCWEKRGRVKYVISLMLAEMGRSKKKVPVKLLRFTSFYERPWLRRARALSMSKVLL